MSLALFLDPLSINFPCILLAQVLVTVWVQDRCRTQLCWRNRLECAHRQFSTFREHQKRGSHPFENASFIFQQKSNIITLWGSSHLINSGPFCLSLLLTPGISPSLPIAQHPDESVSRLSVTPPPTTTGWLSLLDRLKAVINSLPMEVPYGIDSDDVAVFAGSPHAHIQQDNKAWENLDPLLNQVVGYGATPETISQCIQRGSLGRMECIPG